MGAHLRGCIWLELSVTENKMYFHFKEKLSD